jgi:hypothetical protein
VAEQAAAAEGGSTVRKHCSRRLNGLKQNRSQFEGDWKQIAALCAPARSRFLSSDTNKGRQSNRRLNNSHGIFAMETLQNGMTSGLSSPDRPWFTLKSVDDSLDEQPEVRAHLSIREKLMYDFIASTNLYGVLKTGYLELGAFGTEAAILMENRRVGMVGHALTSGEYWIGLNDEMVAGSLYRECPLTAEQAIGMFGADNVSSRVNSLYAASNYDEQVIFYHAIEENPDYEEGMIGWRGKPWRSVYWEDGGKADQITQLLGFYEQPFWSPRWDTTGNDAYGQGPGHNALPDLRELQLQTKRKAELTDLLAWPELVTTSKTKLKRQPKSVTNVDAADAAATKPVYQVPPQAVQFVMQDIERLEQKINEATKADLFMAITNMAGVQPRNMEEIAARNEEKLTQLGPVIDRVNSEKLKVVIERVHGIMERARMFPPAPDAMRGQPQIKIEFVSILTQMQRMVGLGQLERGSNYVGSIAAVYPEARFKLKPMELADEYLTRAGVPGNVIRSNDDAQQMADQEAQQQQAAAAAEQAKNVSQPFKDMTDAAKVAATIPGSGIPPVQDLVPLVPR